MDSSSSSSSSPSATPYLNGDIKGGGGGRRSQISPTSYDYSFKILVIGDSGVGKSSLLLSFVSNCQNPLQDISPTIDSDMRNSSTLMAVVPQLQYFAKYKVVFLGDESVGKTNIITRFVYDIFDTTYKPTFGIDFLSKSICVEDITVRLQVWDTAGMKRFRSLIPSFIKESSVAVIVYDVSNRRSFLNTTKWIEAVRTKRGTEVIIVLVGNKNDLVDKRQVAVEEGDDKACESGVIFIETSAKAGFNTKPLFQNIAVALSGIKPPSSVKQEDKVDVNLKSSGNMPAVTSRQSVQGSLDKKNIMALDTVSPSTKIEHYKNNTKELTAADDFAEASTKTNDNNSLMMSNNENKIKDELDHQQKDDMDVGKQKGYLDMEDKRPSSMLERMMEEMLKRMDEIQKGNRMVEERINEVKGRCQCRMVYDQRCDDILKKMEDMLKRMNEMQEGNRRVEERIKEVEGLSERGRLDDIKRWEDISKRLAEMADGSGIFMRLENLKDRLRILDYKESYEPLKNLQHKDVEEDDFEDAVFV